VTLFKLPKVLKQGKRL